MKKIGFFILLFAITVSCEPEVIELDDIVFDAGIDDYIELIKCLLGKAELIKDVTVLIEAIKTGEYQQLLVIAMRLYTDGKAAFDEFLKGDEDVPVELSRPLTIKCPMYCIGIVNPEKKRNVAIME